MFIDGYKFWFTFKTDKTSYYRCCRYNSKCLGKCAIDENGKVRHTSEHNHPPEPNRAILEKFRKALTKRAAKESTELYKIYCDEATKHVDAALLYPFTSAESAMRKARRKQLPKSPNTVRDIVDTLDHNKDLFRVHSGQDKDALYQKTLTIDDCICMIFMHKKTYDLFSGNIEEVHVDGSFEFVTQNQPNYYLITFHAVQGVITAPLVYSVSTAKTQSACTAVFSYLRDELKIRPNIFVSDFDPIMQTSLGYVYPDTVIKGSWFHYTDAVLSQMKSLNLRKETAKGIGASALRMMLVLPLLPPEYMVPGLESTKKWMKEKTILSEGFSSLCDYVENSWLRAIGTKKMSIFGSTRLSSNHLKNFNKELSSIIGHQNPVIWVILDSLTQLATKIYVKTSRKFKNLKNSAAASNSTNISSGGDAACLEAIKSAISVEKKCMNMSGKSLKRSELISETVISSATQVWIKTPVHLRNPLSFLQLVSHCINDTMFLENMSDLKERNNLHPIVSTATVTSIVTPNQLVVSSNTSSVQTQSTIADINSAKTLEIPTSSSMASMTNPNFSTITWSSSGHSDVALQNCDSPLQDLQNAPNSPSLSVILQENTFNCPSITHQEFLLAQPGQAPLDSHQSTYTSCFAQSRTNTSELNNSQENRQMQQQELQHMQCSNQNQNFFTFNQCGHTSVDIPRASDSCQENSLEINQSEQNVVQHLQQQQHCQQQQQHHQQHQQHHQQQQQHHQQQQQHHCQQHQQIHEINQNQSNQRTDIDHCKFANSSVKVLSVQSIPNTLNVKDQIRNQLPNSNQNLSEPPPLVFFSSVKRLPCKRILPILSEPPPLVPISNNYNGINISKNLSRDIKLNKNLCNSNS